MKIPKISTKTIILFLFLLTLVWLIFNRPLSQGGPADNYLVLENFKVSGLILNENSKKPADNLVKKQIKLIVSKKSLS